MAQTSSSKLLDRSRLEGLLVELSDANLHGADYNLAERLSYMMGVAASLNLARSLKMLSNGVADYAAEPYALIESDVMSECQRMMSAITVSFVAQTNSSINDDQPSEAQLKVPSALGLRLDSLQTYEPYQRFYLAHQAEMALGLQALRVRIRKSLSGVSVELRQLAELDAVLDENLAGHTRKLFNVIPTLLGQRFHALLDKQGEITGDNDDELEQWLKPNGWLAIFYHDMRELLLAEFDVRLQPILGLLEAFNEQTEIS